MSKTLIIYYSFEGSTREIAESISRVLKADLMEVKPIEELKSKGFSKFIWGGYQVVTGKKPELNPLSKNLDDYDTVFIGTPIWAGTYAPPIKSLIEDYIEGKKVAYFYCHEGGHKKAIEKAKQAIEKKNAFIGAKGFMNPKKNLELSSEEANNWAKLVLTKTIDL
ncbi:NAD(P)H-dependent oxidoreductase [Mycoplasmatota bacterium zrk1]